MPQRRSPIQSVARYRDLEPFTGFGRRHARYLRAVGWIDWESDFETGKTHPETLALLAGRVAHGHWQPGYRQNFSACELCEPGQIRCRYYSAVYTFPAKGVVYVAPEHLLDLAENHAYRIPREVQRAICRCPHPIDDSQKYYALLRRVWRQHRVTK